MNKRITSIVLCLVLLVSLMAAAVPVSAEPVVALTVKADKTEANVGDTITYTIAVNAVEDLGGLVFELAIPEGLTFVAGSSNVNADLKGSMNFGEASFAEATKVFVGVSNESSNVPANTVLMTFKCTVDEGASGDLTIGMLVLDDDVFDGELNNIPHTESVDTVTIGGGAPVPPPASASVDFTVKADAATANPGDTITFEVSVAPVDNVGGIVFTLNIPEGLSFVAGSSSVNAALKGSMNFGEASFAEATLVFVGVSNESSNIAADTVLMTFQCTVDAAAAGSKTVTLDVLADDVFDADLNNIPFTVTDATVSVEAAGCAHDWADADCDSPKTCKLCGETEGSALGHGEDVTYTNNGDTHSATYDCCGAAYVTNEAHSYDATKTCVCGAVKVDDFYTVAGSEGLLGTNWDPADMNNLLVLDPATGIYSKTYENVAAGSYEFKVVLNGAWGTEYNLEGNASGGAGNAKAVVAEDGSTVIIGFDGEKALLQIIAPVCEHDWADADCDTAKTCKVCGATEGEALGHSWSEATCTEPKHCTVCGHSVGTASHDWADADCENPKTCKICGETEGEALGHDWADADCDTAKTCKVCGATDGSALGHSWDNASCTAPKTCKVCGATEGSALGHDWEAADCDTAKTCKVCGATEGEPNGHDWADADCQNPKTCTACGATEGEKGDHVDNDGDGKCDVCGCEKTPVTGDESVMGFAVILMIAAVCGVVVVCNKKKFIV